MIPCLLITWNRLEYTKQALRALLHSDCGKIYIIDNNSTDGTKEYLGEVLRHAPPYKIYITWNHENFGIAYAINQFLSYTQDCAYVGKVDNDTLVPCNWCSVLLKKMLAHNIDIIQAKHPIIPATYYGKSFDEWTHETMLSETEDSSIWYNKFVGGSGIIFNRQKVDKIPETEWKLGGWRQFQREHPELKKAFCTDVSIDLLDAHGYGDYESYYKETGRVL